MVASAHVESVAPLQTVTAIWVRIAPAIGVPVVVTAVAVSCGLVVVPFPSCPLVFSPQQ